MTFRIFYFMIIRYCRLQTFRPHKSIEKAASTKLNATCSDDKLDKIQITEVYKPKGAIAEFFEKQGKMFDLTLIHT